MKPDSIQQTLFKMSSLLKDRIAIEWGDKTITYYELDRQSNAISNFLISRNKKRGIVVAILLERVIDLIPVIIGVIKAGCIFAPLNPLDPDHRLQSMITDIEPDWIISEESFIAKFEGIIDRSKLIMLNSETASIGLAGENLVTIDSIYDQPNGISLNDTDGCYIYFTSGSQGRPKAILGTMKGLTHFIKWEVDTLKLEEGCRVSQLTPPTFDPFLRDIFVPLASGGTICVPVVREGFFDIKEIITWIDSSKINVIHCVPTIFRAIVNSKPSSDHFLSLKFILIAGDLLHGTEVGKWIDIFDTRIQLINLYGPTETTLAKFYYFINVDDRYRKIIPVGKPMKGAKAIILDDGGNICPPGVIGEIYIRSPFRSLGYYRNNALTDEVFIQNPFSNDPQDLVYKTGDMGRVLDDGNFEILGRKDFQTKIRGMRVEIGEIEKILLDQEQIKDAVVRDWEDKDGEKNLCAYLVISDPVTEANLRDYLSKHLPPYMIPATFIFLDELPINLHGKIDRKALPDPRDKRESNIEYVAPRNEIEQHLTDIWKAALQYQGDIGIDDSFFSLGGHSLNVTQVLSRMNSEYEVEISLRDFFNAPTIREMAFAIVKQKAEQVSRSLGPAVLNQIMANLDDTPDSEDHQGGE